MALVLYHRYVVCHTMYHMPRYVVCHPTLTADSTTLADVTEHGNSLVYGIREKLC